MKVTIDNYDGQGAVDVTASLTGATPLTIERKLNQPSSCTIALAAAMVTVPVSGARTRAVADNGTVLFTGYVSAVPARVYAGMGTPGPAYELQVSCASDEVVLDAEASRRTVECVATTAGDMLQRMTQRASLTIVPTAGSALVAAVGGFQPLVGKSWSANVGALADASRASYRMVDGAVLFNNVGDQAHRLAEANGSLDRGALRGGRTRAAVNDVTVCGRAEPQTYVTEIFEGDGVTTAFELSETPLLEQASLLFDTFGGTAIDPQYWSVSDGGNHLSLTARGLTLGRCQGVGGVSTVAAVDTVEMGGVLTIELSGLQIDAQGEGYFAGLSNGSLDAANLVAGFHVRPNGSAMAVAPMVLGVEAGAVSTLLTGHTYTLRLHYRCKDRQRSLQSYSAGAAHGTVRLGGATLSAGADLLMEVQETTGGALLPAVVLYDGTVHQAPVSCTPVVVNSLSFLGSVASFDLKRPGEVWVRCAPSGSAAATQRLGTAAQSAQAKVASTGRLSFYPGNVPAVGTVVTVDYRLSGVASSRMTAATVALRGGPAAGSLIVTAEHPETRTSADCENAALALLSNATWVDGSWKGNYTCWNPHQTADVWPGDLLQVDAPSAETASDLLVRSVQIHAMACVPELLNYAIGFANEWAEPLTLKVVEGAPAKAWLPEVALTVSAALPSLRDLSIVNVSTSQIQLSAGVAAPSGGGFEVRRSDWKFGAGDGADLVLRSPAENFTIVREAAVERYYVRMYDNASPPNYSRFSSAIFVNVAMQ